MNLLPEDFAPKIRKAVPENCIGTGALDRRHEFLKQHPLKEQFELVDQADGGCGVTIAYCLSMRKLDLGNFLVGLDSIEIKLIDFFGIKVWFNDFCF